jgi:hypothetical protein
MEFWLVVGLVVGVVLLRAADMGFHLDQDRSWMHRPGSSREPR